ncbi:MAG TPA: DUF4190 domain-containing protein [Pyrinomonadaceae bacterium]|nr:DUF4190 domain-containing protein [Pyrinomonadaceae bacterium]
MKRCPTCQRTYPDDAPGFCVSDGAQLFTEESPAFDPQKTMLASAPPPKYSEPLPPPMSPPQSQPQQPIWPPPPPQQQGQNWGGGYYQQQPGQGYAQPYPQQAAKGKALSMTALILGCLSALISGLLLVRESGSLRMDRDTAVVLLVSAACVGAIALVLGLIALFSSRQRGKAMAIVGMVLGLTGIAYYIYVETQYGLFF